MTFKKILSLIMAAALVLPPFKSAAGVYERNAELFDLTAESAVMIDAATGFVIYAKNADAALYPASTTKLMTALLLLEYAEGKNRDPLSSYWEPYQIGDPAFDERITFSTYAVYSIEYGSSNIGMDVDESLSLREALYAIMLPSANEVACAVSEFLGGSEDEFAEMMTERAAELGCPNTNFKNGHGLHDPEHYTSAMGLALILKECIKHPAFTEVISSRNYVIPPTERQPEERWIRNTNELIQYNEYHYDYAVGGKTGYTDEARHTLAVYGVKDGVGVITAVMGATKGGKYTDTISLMEYGFGDYVTAEVSVLPVETTFEFVGEYGSGVVTVKAPPETVSLLVPTEAEGKITQEVTYYKDGLFPLQENDAAGEILFYAEGAQIGRFQLSVGGFLPDPTPEPTETQTPAPAATARPSAQSGQNSSSSEAYVPVMAQDDGKGGGAAGGNGWVIAGVIVLILAAGLLSAIVVNVFVIKKRSRRDWWKKL